MGNFGVYIRQEYQKIWTKSHQINHCVHPRPRPLLSQTHTQCLKLATGELVLKNEWILPTDNGLKSFLNLISQDLDLQKSGCKLKGQKLHLLMIKHRSQRAKKPIGALLKFTLIVSTFFTGPSERSSKSHQNLLLSKVCVRVQTSAGVDWCIEIGMLFQMNFTP